MEGAEARPPPHPCLPPPVLLRGTIRAPPNPGHLPLLRPHPSPLSVVPRPFAGIAFAGGPETSDNGRRGAEERLSEVHQVTHEAAVVPGRDGVVEAQEGVEVSEQPVLCAFPSRPARSLRVRTFICPT